MQLRNSMLNWVRTVWTRLFFHKSRTFARGKNSLRIGGYIRLIINRFQITCLCMIHFSVSFPADSCPWQ